MIISGIVAMTRKGVMGVDNKLPWHISEDLKRFKKLTSGHSMIMGRKTYDSIGRALPNRRNIVITRDKSLDLGESVEIFYTLETALDSCQNEPEVFIIGGAQIFKMAQKIINKYYITWVESDIAGDTYFPVEELNNWKSEKVESWLNEETPFVFEDFVKKE